MKYARFFCALSLLVSTPLRAADAPLPKVLIIGDSISIGYTRQVADGLKGRAIVSRPTANCADTRAGLKNLDQWLAGGPWQVIHFNWGLWDLCYRNPEVKTQGNRDKVHGKLAVPLEEYEENLELLVQRLEKTGAILIFASTTVVPEGEDGRFVGDDARYNLAAGRVMKKHGILVDDLHAATKAFGPGMFLGPGNVHYTPEGYAKLAAQVVSAIESVLKK